MKRNDLIREIRRAAKAKGMSFEMIRTSGAHDVFDLDALRIPIPRLPEIGPDLAFEIRVECEPKLGKRWWR